MLRVLGDHVLRLLIDTVGAVSPGIERILAEIVGAMDRQCPDGWDTVIAQSDSASVLHEGSRTRVVRVPALDGNWFRHWNLANRVLRRLAEKHQADVVYSMGFISRAVARGVATVATVNNMIPFTPDQMRHFPLWSKERLRLNLLQRQFRASLSTADAVILHSQHALHQVSSYVPDLAEKTTVVLTGIPRHAIVDPATVPPHPYNGRPYLFYLSAIHWYKNHLGLIEAYRIALRQAPDLPDLLIAGQPSDHAYVASINETIQRAGLSDRVINIGVVPDNSIKAWLHHATVNLFPSTCETNSLVQSEILGAQGVMACSDVPPMTEVAGNAAALFDPYDPNSIAVVILQLCADDGSREDLRRRSAHRATELSWNTCADATWSTVERAVSRYRERRHRA